MANSSPTMIARKLNLDQSALKGNLCQRTTEVAAFPKRKRGSTVLDATNHDDYSARILCEYNLGKHSGFHGTALVVWVAGRVGCFPSLVRKTLIDAMITKC